MRRFIIGVASVGYAGYCPFAPGTAGTGAGILIYLLCSSFPPLLYALSTAALFALACWVSGRAEALLERKDSPKIVIDEVVGFLIAMAFLPPTLPAISFGFLFFRLFDIMKPPPANWVNRKMEGGLGVVLDDVVAGFYANLLFRLISPHFPALFP